MLTSVYTGVWQSCHPGCQPFQTWSWHNHQTKRTKHFWMCRSVLTSKIVRQHSGFLKALLLHRYPMKFPPFGRASLEDCFDGRKNWVRFCLRYLRWAWQLNVGVATFCARKGLLFFAELSAALKSQAYCWQVGIKNFFLVLDATLIRNQLGCKIIAHLKNCFLYS